MKRISLFSILVLILIFGIVACGQKEEAPKPVQKPKLSKEERAKLRAQRREENKKLYEIAISGKDENIKYVRLTRENNFTDMLADNLTFTRDATSGPGTGKFTGQGFEFTQGSYDDVKNETAEEKKKRRWRKKINKCQSSVIQYDWCARQIDDPSVFYTIRFLSWKIGNDAYECAGACREHDYQTAYIRIKNQSN